MPAHANAQKGTHREVYEQAHSCEKKAKIPKNWNQGEHFRINQKPAAHFKSSDILLV